MVLYWPNFSLMCLIHLFLYVGVYCMALTFFFWSNFVPFFSFTVLYWYKLFSFCSRSLLYNSFILKLRLHPLRVLKNISRHSKGLFPMSELSKIKFTTKFNYKVNLNFLSFCFSNLSARGHKSTIVSSRILISKMN